MPDQLPVYEVVRVHPLMRDSEPPIYEPPSTGLDCINPGGVVRVPDGPGLGTTCDWEYIRAHQTGHWVLTL